MPSASFGITPLKFFLYFMAAFGVASTHCPKPLNFSLAGVILSRMLPPYSVELFDYIIKNTSLDPLWSIFQKLNRLKLVVMQIRSSDYDRLSICHPWEIDLDRSTPKDSFRMADRACTSLMQLTFLLNSFLMPMTRLVENTMQHPKLEKNVRIDHDKH